MGRVYKQTLVDTYSKVAFAKLYITKAHITAADLFNDKVLPFFAEQDLPMLRILTDHGSEYCGRAETNDYRLHMAISDIEHSKTKVSNRKTNGICERFHKTILQEFCQRHYGKKFVRGFDLIATRFGKLVGRLY